jgi:hypothetical protein
MMARRVFPIFMLFILLSVYLFTVPKVTQEKKRLSLGEGNSSVLPSAVLKLTSLDFDGLVSDFFFLRAIVFYGGTFERTETPRIKDWEWKWMHDTLRASTDLDVYFLDPYYVGAAMLPWYGNMPKETNELLEKGSRARYWDWTLPFYIGFNYFYFYHDSDKASEYLMESSKRPGSGRVISTLASRLAYEANRTENAILFLEEILRNTSDESMKKEYTVRLRAFKDILYLEQGAATFKKRFGRNPRNLSELVDRKIITGIPKGPYGKEFFIDKNGMIKTTSDLLSIYPGKLR